MADFPPYWPNIGGKCTPEVEQAIRLLFTGHQDHETAIGTLATKTVATPATAKSASTAQSSSTALTPTPVASAGLSIGGVNNQTGTSYALLPSDNGGIVTLSNSAAVAVSLTSSLSSPFFAALENLGAGQATITPSTGRINGLSNVVIGQNQSCFLFFDGANWWAATQSVVPSSFTAVVHQFLTAYSAATGLFTSAQPAFSDISGSAAASQVPALSSLSGQITTSQLPASGLTATITTAALTSTGTRGSMTFTNGLLTAYTAAT